MIANYLKQLKAIARADIHMKLQTISEPTMATYFGQRKCQVYMRNRKCVESALQTL